MGEFTSRDRGKELAMKIGFTLCLLACLASGLLAYRGKACAKCNYENEACCSWPGGSVFCHPKSFGSDVCPPGSQTEHPGFTGPEQLEHVGSCNECLNSEVCCITRHDPALGHCTFTINTLVTPTEFSPDHCEDCSNNDFAVRMGIFVYSVQRH